MTTQVPNLFYKIKTEQIVTNRAYFLIHTNIYIYNEIKIVDKLFLFVVLMAIS